MRDDNGHVEIDDLIAAVLRGDDGAWPSSWGAGIEADVLRRVHYHGVAALLHEQSARLGTWPAGLKDGVRREAMARAFWELRHQHVIAEVVQALGATGIDAVLFKGTALAYGLYANPVRRARGDTDMIVAPQAWGAATRALLDLGFERSWGVTGELVSYQESFAKDVGGGRHVIDLHRRINNSELLSRLFSFADLRADAVPLAALAPAALAAGPVDALLLACLHRSTHIHNPYIVDEIAYLGADRLIWLYDIHLLALSLHAEQWRTVVRRAQAKGLCATTLAGIERARSYFGTPCPDDVRRDLCVTGEPVAYYLATGRLRQSWLDFLAIEGAGDKLRFARELVFPPADYMRAKYATERTGWLPWLYARRATEGVLKRVGGHRAQ